MAKKNRVIKYKKPRNINIGIVIFGITFIYLIINLILYISNDKITIYEVTEGKSANNVNSYYTGIVIRNETVNYASKNGYINFFVRDGSHVSIGTNLYTIDESGKLASIIDEHTDDNNMSQESLDSIKDEIYQFSTGFTVNDFSNVYDLKNGIEALILENYNDLNPADLNAEPFEIVKADQSGTVLTYIDGYESVTCDTVKKDDFNTSNYKKTVIKSNDLIEQGSPIYKTINSDEWYLLIPLTDEEAEKYKNEKEIEIMFIKDNLTTSAEITIIENSGAKYGKISLNKYNIRYLNDRFLDIKIINKEMSGLKIPKTSVFEKDFYVIPESYCAKGGDNNEDGFYKEVYTEDGQTSIVFETPTIYYKEEGFYYVEKSAFKEGDVIVMSDSSSRYQIGETKTLKGVYNINNGYTDFKQIVIKAETNDYYIVEKNTSYGLITYDYIVLDASLVKENQVVCE